MTSERVIKSNLAKIKKAIAHTVSKIRESEKVREDLFAEILSTLDQEHEKFVGLVQICKYELIFDDLLNNSNSHEENEEDDLLSSDVYSFTVQSFSPPGYSTHPISELPTGENNQITVRRLVVAAKDKIYYEDLS